MKTFSFIGSDKNAGKTTAFNFIVSQLKKSLICLTSIGINGEFFDSLENHKKPAIKVPCGALFVTTVDQLKTHPGSYELIEFLYPPTFSKNFVLAKSLGTYEFILEGPNQKSEILSLKNLLESLYPEIILLIDGSIDRQFLGHPTVSDAFYFSLLLSQRPDQKEKAKNLLYPLYIPLVDKKLKNKIEKLKDQDSRSLLFIDDNILYRSKEIPGLDKKLEELIHHPVEENAPKKILYLNGALSKTLARTIAPKKDLIVILDNFTLFQNISQDAQKESLFRPPLFLFHPLNIKGIFLKEEQGQQRPIDLKFSKNIPIFNIYREIPHEITAES